MITKITKMVPKKYYVIDGVEFAADELFETLDTITSKYNNWYISSLDLPDECPYELAKLGYLELKTMYESVFYRDTEDRKAKKLLDELIRM